MHDILYIVRPGEKNPELRFSLRSLRNLAHGAVWIVGHQPRWVTNVRHIPGNPTRDPHVNVFRNILTACESHETPDQFVVMNDDFYLTRPIATVPNWFRSTLERHIGIIRSGTWWWKSLTATRDWLQQQGHLRPLSYELHKPILIDKNKMADALRRVEHIQPSNPPQWRTIYGNVHHIGGTPHPRDGKAYRAGPIARPFHSTEDGTFRHFETGLRELFPDASAYEIPGSDRHGR